MEVRPRSKRLADKEKPVNRVHDYFEKGGGIFIQYKLDGGDWEDNTHLIFAKNGPRRFVLTVEGGERAELQLLCNANFPVLSVPSDSGREQVVDIAGRPIGIRKTTVKTYYDLLYLTAKSRALRVLEGPGTWTFDSIFDQEKDTLCVAVTGRHREKLLWYKLLRLPLYIPRQSRSEPWGVVGVNWDEMERETPGVREAQKPHLAGITEISRAPKPSRSKQKTPILARAVQGRNDVDSDDEPLIRRSVPGPKRRPATQPGPSVSSSDSGSDDRPLIKRHQSAQLSARKSISSPAKDARPSQSTPPPPPLSEVGSKQATVRFTGLPVPRMVNLPPASKPGEPPGNSAPTPEPLSEQGDYISSPSPSSSDSSYDSSECYNGTWKTILRRPVRMETAFIDPKPLPQHPQDWLMSRRRPVLQLRESASRPSLVVVIPFNPYRDHPVVEMLRREAGRG
ncbi:hypothetical protein MMYC01_204746 [Madurella mycetomatis]|uniref:Uncharacterized protein n=1 Tax=Madurella mycetomatis TaxID=100816 RepID=A0A175W663_9PEZI|nr:hypothetical protein MMYC01_204746 [Madurella mycetomatis]